MKKIFAIIKAIRASQAGCGVMKQAHLLITQLLTAGMPMWTQRCQTILWCWLDTPCEGFPHYAIFSTHTWIQCFRPPDASMGPDGTGGESQGGEIQGGETLGQGNNFMEDSQAASQTPPDNPEEPRSQTKRYWPQAMYVFIFLSLLPCHFLSSNSIGIGIIEMSYACNCYTCIGEEALIIGTGHIIGKHHSINAGIQWCDMYCFCSIWPRYPTLKAGDFEGSTEDWEVLAYTSTASLFNSTPSEDNQAVET